MVRRKEHRLQLRLSEETLGAIYDLAEQLGCSRQDVVEMALNTLDPGVIPKTPPATTSKSRRFQPQLSEGAAAQARRLAKERGWPEVAIVRVALRQLAARFR